MNRDIPSTPEHLSHMLAGIPELAAPLKRLCSAWQKNGEVPRSVLLLRDRQSLPEEMVTAFGTASLRLSRDGTVRLRTDILLEPLTRLRRKQWIADVHQALGIPFVEPQRHNSDLGEETVRRFHLTFPDFAAVKPMIEREARRSVGFEQWEPLGRVVQVLLNNEDPVTLSELGARFFGDSKTLRSGREPAVVAECLYLLDGGEYAELESARGEVRRRLRREALSNHGVVETGGSVTATVFGPVLYRKAQVEFDHIHRLSDIHESTVLSASNLQNVDKIHIPPDTTLITVENESPFAALVRERHPGVILYTQGFPNAAVRKLYHLIGGHPNCARRLHWGDSDPAGLRIAAILLRICPLELWRCEYDTLVRHKDLLQPLSPTARKMGERIIEGEGSFPFLRELRFTLEHGWLEQEQYRAEPPRPADSDS